MGHTIRIHGLPKTTRRLFRRALALSGAGSQAQWLSTQIRRLIREQEEQFGGDLLRVLTSEERDLLDVIKSGAAEPQQIVEESLLPAKKVEAMLADLIERGLVERRPKGGKTEQARGAKIMLYFVIERDNS